MHLFHEAQEQLCNHMSAMDAGVLHGSRIVQLGDLGDYDTKPGSRACFKLARQYLDAFGVPRALITGNHDLEGEEFETDEENLEAWQREFGQRHYWAADLGRVLAVGLSTTRFRSNKYSVHEVYVDEEQLQWLEALLSANSNRPVVVFTHAPPIGCGLKVLTEVHVKNRCAWLNHSERPERFAELAQRWPNVRLWFSGHFHLSHNYADSVAVHGGCAFVQTGVIGECNRDGYRHSRLLLGDEEGYRVFTVDHDSGERRLDVRGTWAAGARDVEVLAPPPDVLLEPTRAAGWLSSQLDCRLDRDPSSAVWYPVGPGRLLSLQDDLLVEYDAATLSPIGLVDFVAGRDVALVTADGGAPHDGDGADVWAVVLRDPGGGEEKVLTRNAEGGFFQIYQPNKWLAKRLRTRLEQQQQGQQQRKEMEKEKEKESMVEA